ncbi:MAG: hypothetical protein K2Q34_08225 [Alphaproteobacteria bacterium]|nr:hypothetical protein [Alphaproteobacteria bacterium]
MTRIISVMASNEVACPSRKTASGSPRRSAPRDDDGAWNTTQLHYSIR